ncbi:MAG: GAF domain-containing sensor histidine kinase [Vicinamibacteria bacterium]|jgi:signal transduction histidine kinase|nr:GAF domain-containing sensor histidine kinase [Vicinamibacteria bacterium]
MPDMPDSPQSQRLSRLEVVLAMGLAIDRVQARRGGLDELLVTVHEGISQLMDAQNFYVALCDEERRHFRFAYYRDTVDPEGPTRDAWIPLEPENGMLTAWVIKEGMPLILDAEGFLARDRAGAPGPVGPRPNHWMGMPLLRDDGQAVGAMVVQSYDPARNYNGEDQALFKLLANNVALSIGRVQRLAWLEEAVRGRTRDLEAEVAERRRSEALQGALYEISALFTDGADQTTRYAKLHKIIGRLIPARNFFVAIREPDGDHFRMDYFVDETEPVSRQGQRVPMGDGLTSLLFRTGEPLLLDQPQVEELVRSGQIGRRIGTQSFVHWLGVPLILLGKTIGAIVTQSYDARVTYSRQDLELVKFVGENVAGAIEKLEARHALEEVQRELVKRNEALSAALDDLRSTQGELVRQERLASLGALVAGVSHEINTPLGVCVTATSHLEEELKPVLAERARGALSEATLTVFLESAEEALRILKSNTRRAARLIQSFKQISVDQSSGEMRTVHLAEYLREVLAALRPTLKGRTVHIELDCPEDLTAHTYPGALAQVITNLVMNSVIHGFEGRPRGRMDIVVRGEENALCLQYADDGRGMEAEALKKLFDPFFTTKRGSGGSGLGAHIVYNLITGPLGGRVQVESAPEKGVRFDIRLPLGLDPSARTGAAVSQDG